MPRDFFDQIHLARHVCRPRWLRACPYRLQRIRRAVLCGSALRSGLHSGLRSNPRLHAAGRNQAHPGWRAISLSVTSAPITRNSSTRENGMLNGSRRPGYRSTAFGGISAACEFRDGARRSELKPFPPSPGRLRARIASKLRCAAPAVSMCGESKSDRTTPPRVKHHASRNESRFPRRP